MDNVTYALIVLAQNPFETAIRETSIDASDWENLMPDQDSPLPAFEPIPKNHGDIRLNRWLIFESKGTRHIFGQTANGQYFTSSPILEETDEWIRTRSRRYWQGLNHFSRWGPDDQLNLVATLNRWSVVPAEVTRVIAAIRAEIENLDSSSITDAEEH